MTSLRLLVAQIGIERDVEKCTVARYDKAARHFGDYLGREATESDLTEQAVNGFVLYLQNHPRPYDPVSVKNYRRDLLVIWNFAASIELVGEYSRARLRRPKTPRKPILAWDPSEVSAIEAAARELPGVTRRGCSVREYVTAYTLVASDTLLRPSDMRLLTWQNYEWGHFRIVQHKTGIPIIRPLRATTREALERLRPYSTGLIFWLSKSTFRKHEDKLRRAAGVFRKGQALGRLRHSGATAIGRRAGISAAAESLGHAPGSVVAAQFYVAPQPMGQLPWPVASLE